jgi:sulfoquinovosidase
VRALAGATLACLAMASPAAAAVDRTVDAGALRATVSASPFAIDFRDTDGRLALRETGVGSGVAHGTAVTSERRDGAAYLATLATDAGGTFGLRVEPDGDGVIRVALAGGGGPTTTTTFAAASGERYLGFGERSNAVDQRGNDVQDQVSEGPYQPAEQPFIAAFVPPAGYQPRADATYYPVPWLLSTRGYGVLDDDADTSTFHLGGAGTWSVEVNGAAQALRVFAGPTPAAALKRFTARTGRQPAAAAPWYFGPWWQPSGDEKQDIATLRAAGAAGSVAQTYTHYLPCAAQTGRADAERQRTALFHAAGLAVTTYFNPMICTSHPRYGEARAKGVLTRNALGQPYEYRYTGSSQFLVGQFDFSAPGAAAFYGSLLGEAADAGYDGWMEDFGEYTPPDSVSADGRPGAQEHNLYPTLYHAAARAFAARLDRPLARFNRSGWTGTAKFAQIVWGGDPTTGWGFDGLQSAVRNGLTMGLSGVSLWGSDIGGYFALSEPQTTPELLVRWIEMGFASGVMRTQANGFALADSPRAQIFDPDVLPVWVRYARLRTQLEPYLAAAERSYDATGMPIMRHLALEWPGDPRATARDDEYMFGDDLLAAPVMTPGATTRTLYLPAGRWVDVWRSLALDAAQSPVLGAARMLEGGRDVTLPAPRAELPLLARAGALLPLLPADVETLTGYGSGLVHLGDRAGRLVLLGWPGTGVSRAKLDTGESISLRERGRRLDLRVHGRRTRRLAFQLSLTALPRAMRPCSVHARGGRVSDWRFDRATKVLRMNVRVRSGVAVVAPCRRG